MALWEICRRTSDTWLKFEVVGLLAQVDIRVAVLASLDLDVKCPTSDLCLRSSGVLDRMIAVAALKKSVVS